MPSLLVSLAAPRLHRRQRRPLRAVVVVVVVVVVVAGVLSGSLGSVSAQDATPEGPQTLRVSPTEVAFRRPEASQQLVVESLQRDAWDEMTWQGVTRDTTFRSSAPTVATVDAHGRIAPVSEGNAIITATHGKFRTTTRVRVHDMQQAPPVSFRYEVLPVLTKAGCNSGGCHGKAEGQNGFKLSIFGFDDVTDHHALTMESRGRRIHVGSPDHSLLLRKGLAETPHGGGQKLTPGSQWHQLLRRWIAEGAKHDTIPAALGADAENAPRLADIKVQSLEVYPAEIRLASHQRRQLRVTAISESGERRCVTAEAEFYSNADSIAAVTRDGHVLSQDVPGEAAILVRYRDQVAICRVRTPRQDLEFKFDRPVENNFIDKLVWNKLQAMSIPASPNASDHAFLRRVYLDVIGRLPSVAEARAYLADSSSDRRSRLVDELLDRPEYATYWAMRWADILRVDKSIVEPQGAVGMTRWVERQLADNVPYDQFVRQIVTARGSVHGESPASFYQVHKDPELASRAISQVFLGVRIECAQCHHHPFERWGQKDYFAFSSFFTSVRQSKGINGPKIVGAEGKDLPHPRTGETIAAAGLGAAPAKFESSDRRQALADWMTARDNPFLARMIANRLWSHYFGRGLVEPIDDIRATNPATNEPLLQALESHLIESNFDLKAFTRALLTSQAYQLSSRSVPNNRRDAQNHSRAPWKTLPAEVLLDAICDATESTQEFNGWPNGVRAIEVWDNRMPSYFFQVFGRPQRVSVCECERGDSPSITQALHLMNSAETVNKIRHRKGRAARLAASDLSPAAIIEELYLATMSRFPTDNETQLMKTAFAANRDRRDAVEDVLWTLLNTKEFVFNH